MNVLHFGSQYKDKLTCILICIENIGNLNYASYVSKIGSRVYGSFHIFSQLLAAS